MGMIAARECIPQAVWLGGCDCHLNTRIAEYVEGFQRVPVAVHILLASNPLDNIARCVHTAKQDPRI